MIRGSQLQAWSEKRPVLLGIPWPALRGPLRNQFWKRGVPSRTGRERILEPLWKPQMPWIIGFGASQPYSRGKFQETLWERFRVFSGSFPEFLPESPSRTGGMAHMSASDRATLKKTLTITQNRWVALLQKSPPRTQNISKPLCPSCGTPTTCSSVMNKEIVDWGIAARKTWGTHIVRGWHRWDT